MISKEQKYFHRKSLRLKNYDYSTEGAYFITLVIKNREPLLGTIINGEMQCSEEGSVISSLWEKIPEYYPNVVLDYYVVMPDHFHGILMISNVVAGSSRHDMNEYSESKKGQGDPAPTIGSIIGYYKFQTTKSINRIRNSEYKKYWQRNYYDRIIRNEKELLGIREYIVNNPLRWAIEKDEYCCEI